MKAPREPSIQRLKRLPVYGLPRQIHFACRHLGIFSVALDCSHRRLLCCTEHATSLGTDTDCDYDLVDNFGHVLLSKNS